MQTVLHGLLKSSYTYSPPLDIFTGAVVGYSLRKLRSAYTGSAIRVKRSSDNTEQDIGFLGNNLNTTDLLSFVGSSDGYITIWYDQVGTKNLTSTSPPKIVNVGTVYTLGAMPSPYFNGSNMFLEASDNGLPTGNATYLDISYLDEASVSGQRVIFDYGIGAYDQLVSSLYFSGSAIGYTQYGSAMAYYGRSQAKNLQIVTKVGNTWSQYLNNFAINGNSMTASTTLGGANSFTVGRHNPSTGGSGYFKGYIQEIIIFNADKTADIAAIKKNTNHYYSIY